MFTLSTIYSGTEVGMEWICVVKTVWLLSLGPVMKKSWYVCSISYKLKLFGEYWQVRRFGSKCWNVGIRGPGSKGKVLLIAAITKYNYFCFRLYFKASMMWCFEIIWLKVICKGKAVLCNKHIMPWWCYFRVCLKYSSG